MNPSDCALTIECVSDHKSPKAKLNVARAAIMGLVAVVSICDWAPCADPPTSDHKAPPVPSPFAPPGYVDPKERPILRDLERISIGDVNRIHQRIANACIIDLPQNIRLQYAGIIGTDSGRLKQRVLNNDPNQLFALQWNVARANFVLFGMWISTEPTNSTAAKCRIAPKTFFVNVEFVDDDRSIDGKLPELGDRSVRDILLKLEKPEPRQILAQDLPVADRAQMINDLDRIMAREANLFHELLIAAFVEQLSKFIYLRNCGAIGVDSSERVQPPDNAPPDPTLSLQWEIVGEFGPLFRLWISTQRMKTTLATCTVGKEKKKLYAQVSFVDGGRSIDTKFVELGDKSIREIMHHLDTFDADARLERLLRE